MRMNRGGVESVPMREEKVAPACEERMTAFCPAFHQAVEIIGRRWSGAILRAMLSGRTRFGEILSAVPGLSDRLLSERLKELEAEGIIERTVVPETPVKIDYVLTEKGNGLADVFSAVSAWAETWAEDPAEHATTAH